jgi:hypothetical protein
MPDIIQQPTEKTSEEMKNELQNSFDELQARNSSLEEQRVLNKSNIEQIRQNTIQSLFSILQNNGVDASNLESINAFLTQLREKSPDLAELFEIAFTSLTEEPSSEQPQTPPADNSGLMSKFSNLAPQTMQGTEQ